MSYALRRIGGGHARQNRYGKQACGITFLLHLTNPAFIRWLPGKQQSSFVHIKLLPPDHRGDDRARDTDDKTGVGTESRSAKP